MSIMVTKYKLNPCFDELRQTGIYFVYGRSCDFVYNKNRLQEV